MTGSSLEVRQDSHPNHHFAWCCLVSFAEVKPAANLPAWAIATQAGPPVWAPVSEWFDVRVYSRVSEPLCVLGIGLAVQHTRRAWGFKCHRV